VGDFMDPTNYARCVWCRQTCHSVTRMQRHVEERLRNGKCDPDTLRAAADAPPATSQRFWRNNG
jgi:hypothetical protein